MPEPPPKSYTFSLESQSTVAVPIGRGDSSDVSIVHPTGGA